MFVLEHEVKIIVPSKDNNGNSLKDLQDKVNRELITLNGGTTVYKGAGYWRDDNDGRDYVDDNNIIVSNCDNFNINALLKIFANIIINGKQEAVSLYLDNTLFILDLQDTMNVSQKAIENELVLK